jgi:asparagine synthase (glutamine-hydrolysing)
MTDIIAHWGPDGAEHWIDGPVGLGHRMLCTTPESLQEKQPFLDEASNLCLTLDGRVDNRDELRAALEAKGLRVRANTDAELVLRAYECWGEGCPERILGDFAFAIWDRRKHQLFCARDPFGIKPFYYYYDGKTFRFASELKAIFADPSIPRELNLPLICLYLLDRFDEHEETIYRGVYYLPQAHCLWLEGDQLHKAQYWDIDPGHAVRYRTDAEYAEHFLSLFQEAVRARLRSHGPVGATLSGGLDSSSVVCTAQMLYQEGVVPHNGFEAFSLTFDGFPCDEQVYIEEVVRKWNVRVNYIPFERTLPWLDIEEIRHTPEIWQLSPFFMPCQVLGDARERGIKIMLDGEGGDNFLWVGFEYLSDLLRQGRIRTLLTQLRHDAALYPFAGSARSLLINNCLKPLIPQRVRTALKPLIHPFRRDGFPTWLNAACFKRPEVQERLRTVIPIPRFPHRVQQRTYRMLHMGWLTSPVIEDPVEQTMAHWGIEHRHPFFDRRLIEFLLAVPGEQMWRAEWHKAVLRQALQGILPEAIRRRQGKAYGTDVRRLELTRRLRPVVEKLIRTSTLATLGLVHADLLLQVFEEYACREAPDSAFMWAIWTFVWLEVSCRSVLGGPTKGG